MPSASITRRQIANQGQATSNNRLQPGNGERRWDVTRKPQFIQDSCVAVAVVCAFISEHSLYYGREQRIGSDKLPGAVGSHVAGFLFFGAHNNKSFSRSGLLVCPKHSRVIVLWYKKKKKEKGKRLIDHVLLS